MGAAKAWTGHCPLDVELATPEVVNVCNIIVMLLPCWNVASGIGPGQADNNQCSTKEWRDALTKPDVLLHYGNALSTFSSKLQGS